MKKILKKVVPKKVIVLGFNIITCFAVIFFSFKFRSLTIRKKTSDWEVFKAVFVRGEFNLPVKIKPGLIIDAGAYTGFSTLYFANKYPNAKIIAVEPEKSNFDILVKHTNNFKNIIRLKAGLWSSRALLKIVDKGTDKWSFEVDEVAEGNKFDIHGVTIGDLLEMSGCEKIDILKIDIEGSEKELFSNNYESWLPKVNIIVIELHDFMTQGCSSAFYSAIKKQDWHEYTKGEKVVLVRKNII